MKRTKIVVIVCISIAALLCVCLFAYINNSDNKSRRQIPEIEHVARQIDKIPEQWSAVSETSETVGAVLLFDGDTKEHIFLVYDISTADSDTDKYTLLAGGVVPVSNSTIVEVDSETFEGWIYASMNQQNVSIMHIESENGFSTVQINPESPFVIILPQKTGEVSFFDSSGNIVPFDEFSI